MGMSISSLYNRKYRDGDYHPKVVAYYFKQWDGFRMPFHEHGMVEIMYVISGACTVEWKDRAFPMTKGDLILIDANEPHRLIVGENAPCRMLNVEFVFAPKEGAFPSFGQLADESKALQTMLGKQAPYVLLNDPGEVYHTLKSLVLELDERNREDGAMIHLLLAQLLLRVARLAEEAEEKLPQQGDAYVKRAIAYMHHHYDCDIQVKDMAAAVNLHPNYLHRIFKTHTGSSPVEYLTALRVDKTKMLLTRTDIPVIEISDYIGMNSRQYFSAVFKKLTGMTPQQFRHTIVKSKHPNQGGVV